MLDAACYLDHVSSPKNKAGFVDKSKQVLSAAGHEIYDHPVRFGLDVSPLGWMDSAQGVFTGHSFIHGADLNRGWAAVGALPVLGVAAKYGRPLVSRGSTAVAGVFGRMNVPSTQQVRRISLISRFDSSIANAKFATPEALGSGWMPPYPDNTVLRSLTLGRETKFVRVHTSPRPQGGFLLTEKQLNKVGTDPEAIRVYLGLPNKPIYVSDVLVPEKTTLTMGRIGPQPNFGLDHVSGFQYQLSSQIPKSSFMNTRLIEEYSNSFSIGR